MKTTIIIAKNGDTYITLAYKPAEVLNKDIKLNSTLRFGEVVNNDMLGFSVRFQIPFFQKFDKDGFKSKLSAVSYEQDILDKHLGEFIASDPLELRRR